MRIDPTKTGQANLLALIIASNPGLAMNDTQVTLGAVEGINEDGFNARVLVTAEANKGFSGTRQVRFKRILPNQGVASAPTVISISPEDTQEQIRTKVIQTLALRAEDVLVLVEGAEDETTDIGIPENEDDTSVRVTIRAKADSYLYQGDYTLQLTVPDIDIPLETAIAIADLDGFDPVTA